MKEIKLNVQPDSICTALLPPLNNLSTICKKQKQKLKQKTQNNVQIAFVLYNPFN